MAVKRVSPEQALELMRGVQGYAYLDVRSVPEFSQGHPAGAYNVPLIHMGPSGNHPKPRFLEVVEARFPKDTPLVVGCRTSARSQQAPADPAQVERVAPLIVITTTGDRVQDRRLLEIGGKGLFTKEIEEALTLGRIDCAIHSMKDIAGPAAAGACASPPSPSARIRATPSSAGAWSGWRTFRSSPAAAALPPRSISAKVHAARLLGVSRSAGACARDRAATPREGSPR